MRAADAREVLSAVGVDDAPSGDAATPSEPGAPAPDFTALWDVALRVSRLGAERLFPSMIHKLVSTKLARPRVDVEASAVVQPGDVRVYADPVQIDPGHAHVALLHPRQVIDDDEHSMERGARSMKILAPGSPHRAPRYKCTATISDHFEPR